MGPGVPARPLGMAFHLYQKLGCGLSHLISIAGLLCRFSCAGHVTSESGRVSFSLLPVFPQNTLSNSYSEGTTNCQGRKGKRGRKAALKGRNQEG